MPSGFNLNSMRQDLSEWALHFIHNYNPDSEPTDQMIDFDRYNGSRFDSWRISDGRLPSRLGCITGVVKDHH